MKVKIKNAYVLIYERKEAINTTTFMEAAERGTGDLEAAFKQARVPKIGSSQIAIPPQIHEKILSKNRKFNMFNYIFYRGYVECIGNVVRGVKLREFTDYKMTRNIDL